MDSTLTPGRAGSARRRGAMAGCIVATLFALSSLLVMSDEWLSGAPQFWQQGVILIAGTLGGWVIGPRATRARSRREWLGAIWRLAALAVAVGALGIGAGLGFGGAARSGPDGPPLIAQMLAGALLLGGIGVVFVGWFVFPITFAAAALWALVMRRLGGVPTSP